MNFYKTMGYCLLSSILSILIHSFIMTNGSDNAFKKSIRNYEDQKAKVDEEFKEWLDSKNQKERKRKEIGSTKISYYDDGTSDTITIYSLTGNLRKKEIK